MDDERKLWGVSKKFTFIESYKWEDVPKNHDYPGLEGKYHTEEESSKYNYLYNLRFWRPHLFSVILNTKICALFRFSVILNTEYVHYLVLVLF